MKKTYKIIQWCSYIGIFFFIGQMQVSAKGCNISDIPPALPVFTSNILNLIKIIVPILLILMGMFDFARSVISSDEKQMKESQSRFIRRALAAVFIFFAVAITQFVFNAIGADNENIVGCIDCFVNGDCQLPESENNQEGENTEESEGGGGHHINPNSGASHGSGGREHETNQEENNQKGENTEENKYVSPNDDTNNQKGQNTEKNKN